MKKSLIVLFAMLLSAGCAQVDNMFGDKSMSFFLTSAGPGKGADLGGLAGADAHCQALAKKGGAGGKIWRAYLSAHAAGGAKRDQQADRAERDRPADQRPRRQAEPA